MVYISKSIFDGACTLFHIIAYFASSTFQFSSWMAGRKVKVSKKVQIVQWVEKKITRGTKFSKQAITHRRSISSTPKSSAKVHHPANVDYMIPDVPTLDLPTSKVNQVPYAQ